MFNNDKNKVDKTIDIYIHKSLVNIQTHINILIDLFNLKNTQNQVETQLRNASYTLLKACINFESTRRTNINIEFNDLQETNLDNNEDDEVELHKEDDNSQYNNIDIIKKLLENEENEMESEQEKLRNDINKRRALMLKEQELLLSNNTKIRSDNIDKSIPSDTKSQNNGDKSDHITESDDQKIDKKYIPLTKISASARRKIQEMVFQTAIQNVDNNLIEKQVSDKIRSELINKEATRLFDEYCEKNLSE